MAEREVLDAKDRQILHLVQRDATLAQAEIAARWGCRRRPSTSG